MVEFAVLCDDSCLVNQGFFETFVTLDTVGRVSTELHDFRVRSAFFRDYKVFVVGICGLLDVLFVIDLYSM